MKKLYTFLDNLLKFCSSSVEFSLCLKLKIVKLFKMNLFIEGKPAAEDDEEN